MLNVMDENSYASFQAIALSLLLFLHLFISLSYKHKNWITRTNDKRHDSLKYMHAFKTVSSISRREKDVCSFKGIIQFFRSYLWTVHVSSITVERLEGNKTLINLAHLNTVLALQSIDLWDVTPELNVCMVSRRNFKALNSLVVGTKNKTLLFDRARNHNTMGKLSR